VAIEYVDSRVQPSDVAINL